MTQHSVSIWGPSEQELPELKGKTISWCVLEMAVEPKLTLEFDDGTVVVMTATELGATIEVH